MFDHQKVTFETGYPEHKYNEYLENYQQSLG